MCQDQKVNMGARMYDVQALCGPADFVQQHTETRQIPRAIVVPCRQGMCTRWIVDTVSVTVEEWTYDRGSDQRMRYLTFQDGRLYALGEGDYGHK